MLGSKPYIAFCGAGGVGKTTTAALLAKWLELDMVPSVSRGVLKQFNVETEAQQQKMAIQDLIALQSGMAWAKFQQDRGIYARRQGGISDRTVIDHYAYMLYRCHLGLNKATIDDMEDRIQKHLHVYDAVFYFPLVDYPTQDDGVRQQGYGYRKTIDMLITGIVTELNIEPICVPKAGDKVRRAMWVSQKIDDMFPSFAQERQAD